MGMIKLDSSFAKKIGFTSDKFEGYLWRDEKVITISVIISLQEGQGHLRELIERIEEKGYHILVPTPMPAMMILLKRWGFTSRFQDGMFGPVNIWEAPKK